MTAETKSIISDISKSAPSAVKNIESALNKFHATNGNDNTCTIRKNLLYSALSFLNYPNVQSTSAEKKRHFLLKKGLTGDEIDLALNLSISRPTDESQLKQELDILSSLSNGNVTFSNRLLNLFILAGFTYGAYTFYQKILLPFIFPEEKLPTEPRSGNERIDINLMELNTNLSSLIAKFTVLHKFLDEFVIKHNTFSKKVSKELNQIKNMQMVPSSFTSFPVSNLSSSSKEKETPTAIGNDLNDMIINMNWGYKDKQVMSDSPTTNSPQSTQSEH